MTSIEAPAYDDTGDRRPLHKVEEGDLIEWKRNGSTGFACGRVTCLLDPRGSARPIRIMPYMTDKSGPTGGRERWIGLRALMRVYDREGKRKCPIVS